MGHGSFVSGQRSEKVPWHFLGVTLRVDISRGASLWLRLCSNHSPMTEFEKLRCVLTDSHFLIPVIVFGIGLALLITLH